MAAATADPPAWSPHSRDTSAAVHCAGASPARRRRLCTAVRMPRRMLTSFRSSSARCRKRRMRAMRCVPLCGAVVKLDLLQHLREVRIEALHLPGGVPAARRRAAGSAAPADARAEQLIGHHLHRHGEIQRRISLARRNPQQHVRRLQLLVGEPGALGSEQHRRRCTLRLGDARAPPPRARPARGNTARARAR